MGPIRWLMAIICVLVILQIVLTMMGIIQPYVPPTPPINGQPIVIHL